MSSTSKLANVLVEMTPRAVRVPAWMFARDQGHGTVMLAGASRVVGSHPLRYGQPSSLEGGRCDLFLNGELIFRPALILGTNVFQGEAASGLLTSPKEMEYMLGDGEILYDMTKGDAA